jgi:hypothetical protein
LPAEHGLSYSVTSSRWFSIVLTLVAFFVFRMSFSTASKLPLYPVVKEHDGSEDAPFADVAVDSDCSNTVARNFVEYGDRVLSGYSCVPIDWRPSVRNALSQETAAATKP